MSVGKDFLNSTESISHRGKKAEDKLLCMRRYSEGRGKASYGVELYYW